MSPEYLLRYISGRVVAQKKAKALYAERVAPDFTPFEFIRTGEVGLSRIFAWLLDPEGSHAQKSKFLIEFMRWLKLDDSWLELGEDARVSTEVMTQYGARAGFVDVLIACGQRAIAIENKPSAEDQELQITRYLEDMGKRWPQGQCLLYLSGTGDPPSERSIDARSSNLEQERGRLIVRGYAQLEQWLAACRGACRANSVTVMLDGLLAHVDKEFSGVEDNELATDLARSISASHEMLEAALALFGTQQRIYEELIAELISKVTEQAQARGWHIAHTDLSDMTGTELTVAFGPTAPVSFGIRFDQSNYRYLLYGMTKRRRSIPVSKELNQAVLEVVGRGGKPGSLWTVWRDVSANDRFFRFSRNADQHFWLAVRSGSFADSFIEYVDVVQKQLRRKGLLRRASRD